MYCGGHHLKPMNMGIPLDPDYVQLVGTAVYAFSYYEWIIIYIIDGMTPGFVSEYSRDRKMTSRQVAEELGRVMRGGTAVVADNKAALDICYDEFASLIPRRNALIHAHPITDTPTGAQILNYQGPVSQAIADMKWGNDAVERFTMDVSGASTKASALLAQLPSRTPQVLKASRHTAALGFGARGFPRYEAYRDSGVEWLGEVPEHWEVKRLEHVASYRTSSVDKRTEDGELPVRLCNYTDVYYQDRIRASSSEFMEATASAREIARFKLCAGDVLITKDSEDWQDIAVPALIDETAEDFLCGYHLGIIRPGPTMHPAFMLRALQSVAVNRQLQTSASGVTRYGLPNAAVTEALVPLPPPDEQRTIAAFLDRETERIDTLIEKKRLLIERLAEYRTALITRTVTRGLPPEASRAAGLDPAPRLKPSGVEWLGEVPEHWEVRRISAAARPGPDSFTDGDWVELPYITDSGVRLIQTGNVGIGAYREQGFAISTSHRLTSFAVLTSTPVMS